MSGYGSSPYGSVPYGGSPVLSDPLADWLPPAGPSVYGGAVYGGFTYGGGAGVVTPLEPEPDVTGRDWDVYLDIQARLVATKAFDEVEIGAGPDDAIFSADRSGPVCVIHPGAGDELDDCQDSDGVQVVRHVDFNLKILARDGEPRNRVLMLDRLCNVVAKALSGKSLAVITHPAMTRVIRGEYLDPRNPGQGITMAGEFQYVIKGDDSHDDSDRDFY